MSWEEYDPCPNCGERDFGQIVEQTEKIKLDDESHDMEEIEVESIDIKKVYCRNCGLTLD